MFMYSDHVEVFLLLGMFCSVLCILFHCVVLCIVCMQMCTVLLPPGVNPIAANEIYRARACVCVHLLVWIINCTKCTVHSSK
jgi:hypothetical protein